MSLPKLTLLLCAAGWMFAVTPAHAGNPSLGGLWTGEFASDLHDAEGTLSAELMQNADGTLSGRMKMQGDDSAAPAAFLLPYMEQDNLFKLRVAAGDVNGDGTACIMLNGKSADGTMYLLMINATLLPADKNGEAPMMFGTYELLRADGQGKFQTEDTGTLGIIAILIG